MAELTISISDELKEQVEESNIDWSEVVRNAVGKQNNRSDKKAAVEEIERIISKSKFTESDADELSGKVKKSMHDSLVREGLI